MTKINKRFAEKCLKDFGHDVGFIKTLLKELEAKTMENIVETYQFNIGYNQAMKDSMESVSKQFEQMFNEDKEATNNANIIIDEMCTNEIEPIQTIEKK